MKVIKIGLIVAMIIGIGGLSFFVPYHSQQKVVDEYVIAKEGVAFVEGDTKVTSKQENGQSKSEVIQADSITHKQGNLVSKEEANSANSSGLEEVQAIMADISEEEERTMWVETMLEKYEDQIAPEDVEDFRQIIGKLDIGHATGLLEDPGGEEGENLLRKYLRSKLSADEYERAKELFFLYNYILFN